jgi:hypothetical protein
MQVRLAYKWGISANRGERIRDPNQYLLCYLELNSVLQRIEKGRGGHVVIFKSLIGEDKQLVSLNF